MRSPFNGLFAKVIGKEKKIVQPHSAVTVKVKPSIKCGIRSILSKLIGKEKKIV